MKVHIRELMNNIEDSSVELEEQNVVSSERIKELTKMKIQNTSNRKHGSKKTVLTIGIAVAVVAALGATAFAALNGGLTGLSFGKSSWGPSIEEDIKNSMPEREFISVVGYADSPEYKAMVAEIARRLNLDSLKFSKLETIVQAIGLEKCQVCTHCFDGSSFHSLEEENTNE